MYDAMIRQQAEETLRIVNAVSIARTGDQESFNRLREQVLGKKKAVQHDEVLERGRREAAEAFAILASL